MSEPRSFADPATAATILPAGALETNAAWEVEASTFLLPTGTVTFLLTDVEQSSATWEAAPEAMAKAISRHYEILGDAVGRHHGVRPVEQGEGDSIVAAFSRGVDAVAAALEAQQRLAAEEWPEGAGLRVRIALHTGDAQLRDAFNYFGQAVIRTARLRSLARGGQVLVSRATHDLVAESLPGAATWLDLGVHRLKDLGRPEHVFQLCHPDIPADFPALRGLDALPNNLPAQLTSFVGRDREIAEATTLLNDNRLVTLTGSGGCGKTRLALQLAANRIDRHADGVWYVGLASLAASGTVARQLADVLHVHEDTEQAVTESLAVALEERSTLIVLDNCEHLLDQCAVLVDTLLRRAAGLHILATSRQVLDVPGETVWRVPSMALPRSAEQLPIDALGTFDAIRLFCDRAARGRPGFGLDAGNAPLITTICARLDGIPLAIELAAARVRSLGLDEILRGLDDRFRLLTGGARTLLPRQQTLAASVDWSYDLLDEHEQTVFRRLSVFAGAFTSEAAAAIATDASSELFDELSALVDRSLLQLDDSESPSRYRYLETVKAYGRARLAASAEDLAIRDRHLRYFLDVALDSIEGILRADQERWLHRLDREHDDLRSALDWASSSHAIQEVLQLASATASFWHARGHAREAQAWFARVLDEAPDGPPLLRGRVLWASAYQAFYTDDIALAIERATAALAAAEEAGDEQTIARCHDTLASCRQFSDPAGTQRELLAAASQADRVGDIWCRTDALQKAAFSDFYRDRWPEAFALAAEGVAAIEELGNPFFLSWHETLMAMGAARQGRFGEAIELARSAYDHACKVGEPMTIAVPAWIEASAVMQRGHVDEVDAIAQRLATRLADHASDGIAGVLLAHLASMSALARGDAHVLVDTMGPICEGLVSGEILYPTATFLAATAIGHLALGDLDSAEASARSSVEMARALQSEVAEAEGELVLARISRIQGRPDVANIPARRAMATLLTAGIHPSAVDALEIVAGCLLDLGNFNDALRLLAASSAIRETKGWHGMCPSIVGASAAQDMIAARAAVGSAAAALIEEGSRLSLTDAFAFANRSRGQRDRPQTGWPSLTPTELAVVHCIARGLSNPDIATELLMSRATVKTHVSHVLTKLTLSNRAEIAAFVTRQQAS